MTAREYFVSIGTDPDTIGGIYINKSLYTNGQRAPVKVDSTPYDLSPLHVGGYKFDGWLTDRGVHVADLSKPKTTVWFDPRQSLERFGGLSVGILAAAYRRVECSGDAEEIIALWPDGTWKRRRRCVDGYWIYETQPSPEGGRKAGESLKVSDQVTVELIKGKRPKHS